MAKDLPENVNTFVPGLDSENLGSEETCNTGTKLHETKSFPTGIHLDTFQSFLRYL